MNKKRRKYLQKSIGFLWEAQRFIDNTLDDEQECLDNIPENFECTDRYYDIEDNIDRLSEASDMVDNVILIIESIAV